MNRKSVLTSRLTGKEHKNLPKLCGVIGLAPPISDVRCMEHMNFHESIGLEPCLENMKSAGERARCLLQKEYGVDSTDFIDVPASFNGSWYSHGWSANRGIISAIAEVSSHIIDAFYKCHSCTYSLKNAKENGKFFITEYLDAVIEHEPSPQISKLFYVFLKKKLLSTIILHEK